MTTEEAVDEKNKEFADKNKLSWIAGRVMEIARTSRAEARESKALLKEATTLIHTGVNDSFYEWHQSIHRRILAETEAENES